MLEAAAETEHDIRVGLAERVGGTGVRVGCADLGKRRWRHDPWVWQLECIQAHRLLDLDRGKAEMSRQATGGGANFLGGRLLVLKAPTPVLASAGAHDLRA